MEINMLNMQEICLKKKLKLVRKNGFVPATNNNIRPVVTFLRNIENLGFTFSPNVINTLKSTSTDMINDIYNRIVPILKEMKGDNVKHKPMYPNFPKQVINASDAELYLNALLHYFTSGIHDLTEGVVPVWVPKYKKEQRKPLNQQVKFKVIDECDEDEFCQIFTDLVSSNTSITDFDREIIDWFFDVYDEDDIFGMLPDTIPFKEQMGFVCGKMINKNFYHNKVEKYIDTVTDVLRIAVSMSDGDVSLANNCKFRNFKRKERKYLLSLIENINYKIEDMSRYRNKWIRLGERLNPGDYKNLFHTTLECFNVLRNGDKIETFSGKIERLIDQSEINQVCNELVKRPGEFARQLDRLIRTFPKSTNDILISFGKIGHYVSTPVLIQLYNHFLTRTEHIPYRIFFPKGKVSNSYIIENNLKPLNNVTVNNILNIIRDILEEKFSKLESLGMMYINPDLKNYTIPLTMRNQLTGLDIVPRGSKFNYEHSTLRFFIHWMNTEHVRVDLDLSCILLDEDFNFVDHVSYTRLRNSNNTIVHSGDLTNAPHPDGATEYFDISTDKLGGVKYIVPQIYSFSRIPFHVIPDCFFGWMDRKDGFKGEIFEPKTVSNKFNLTSDSQVSIPCVIDIDNNSITWLDLSFNHFKGLRNVEATKDHISVLTESMMKQKYMSLFELLYIHGLARAEMVLQDKSTIDEETVVFETNNIDWNNIMNEYLK
jgi:stress response protein SCP2